MGHTHLIEPQRSTLHGRFSRDFEPVLSVSSGDVVRLRTLDVTWGLEQHTVEGPPRRKFEPRMPERDEGPAMCGPIAVDGAEPGMTLAVTILDIRIDDWGWTWVGGSGWFNEELNRALGVADAGQIVRWRLDPKTLIGASESGHRVRLRPFPGTIGMPPNEPGIHSGWAPRATGGNMDCRELIVGSTLYLPIAVPGGLLSVGDGHAAQGNGEVAGSAIECPFRWIDLRLELLPSIRIRAPRIKTATGLLTLGFGPDLNRAAEMALNEMLDLLQRRLALDRKQALALASVVVDLQVTQLVNGVCGVHACLDDHALLSNGG